MTSAKSAIPGRGAASNPKGRFERLEIEPDPELETGHCGRPATVYLRDASRSIISTNTSPDVPFDASLNPYRGCEHGCSYCYARPFHEYLGFSAGLDFETRIVVKENAPELLRHELEAPRWKPKVLGLSGVTDPYQPVERKLGITRGCLEVLAEFRQPVAVITKNHLVTRDTDLLARMAVHRAVNVALSITTLDANLARRLEPRASHPRRRLQAITTLAAAGVSVGVSAAPVIPGLTDHELPAILTAAADAGARFASFLVLRLPGEVVDLFQEWLTIHRPERKEKVLNRLRDLRRGRLSDSTFGRRMRGEGRYAEQIEALYALAGRRAGLDRRPPALEIGAFRRPGGEQMTLF